MFAASTERWYRHPSRELREGEGSNRLKAKTSAKGTHHRVD